jgi:uncharacterized phage protein gp47/JayE
MPFERPTLADLVTRVQTDYTSRLQLTGSLLRRSMVIVQARVIAGVAHLLYGRQDYFARQLFADESEDEFLKRWGAMFGVTPNAPTYATGNITITGVNGTILPAGLVLSRTDGELYTTQTSVTIASGTATVAVQSDDAALAENCDVGTVLTFQSPPTGVTATATVADDGSGGGLTGGTDPEEIEDFRARVLQRMRDPPHGGSNADYVYWAEQVAGVTNVWVYPQEDGAGTVAIRFIRGNDTNPLPTSDEIAAVQAAINAARPVTATVTVKALTSNPLNPRIILTPDTPAIRAAVVAELADLFSSNSQPGGTIKLSQIRTAIGNGVSDSGGTDYALMTPTADFTSTLNQFPAVGTPTWS